MNGSCGVKVIMQQAYSLIGDFSKKRDHNLKKSNFLCDKNLVLVLRVRL